MSTADTLEPQSAVSKEIAILHKEAEARESRPRLDFPPYRSSLLRHPTKMLRQVDPEDVELLGPVFGHSEFDTVEADLTIQGSGEPIGERLVLSGRVVDNAGRPARRLRNVGPLVVFGGGVVFRGRASRGWVEDKFAEDLAGGGVDDGDVEVNRHGCELFNCRTWPKKSVRPLQDRPVWPTARSSLSGTPVWHLASQGHQGPWLVRVARGYARGF